MICGVHGSFGRWLFVQMDFQWISKTFYKIRRLPCQLHIPPFLKSNSNHITYFPPQASLGLWITSKPGDEIQVDM